MNLMKSIFETKDGKRVIAQRPNVPIMIWFVFLLFGRLPVSSNLLSLFELLSFGGLFTWAYLEITAGVNMFRKLLGAGVLAAVIILRLV